MITRQSVVGTFSVDAPHASVTGGFGAYNVNAADE